MKDAPNFAAWSIENLAKFSQEQYQQNLILREAIEQLRLDLKDAMKELRKHQDDWK